MKTKREPTLTKSEAAEEKLRHAILKGDIAPGEWLRQDEVAERFGISSTPVREALRRLEAEGLLERVSRKGVKVPAYTQDVVRVYYDLRLMLEPYSVQLTAERIREEDLQVLADLLQQAQQHLQNDDLIPLTEVNWKFRDTLVSLCPARLVQDLLMRIRRSFQLDTLVVMPERAKDSVLEHQTIYEALCRHDREAAAHAVTQNIENARAAMLAHLPALGINSK
jgi:DNA-binding GntR family transcriptional regulator